MKLPVESHVRKMLVIAGQNAAARLSWSHQKVWIEGFECTCNPNRNTVSRWGNIRNHSYHRT